MAPEELPSCDEQLTEGQLAILDSLSCIAAELTCCVREATRAKLTLATKNTNDTAPKRRLLPIRTPRVASPRSARRGYKSHAHGFRGPTR